MAKNTHPKIIDLNDFLKGVVHGKRIYGSIQVVLHLSLAIHWLNHIWLLNHCLAGIKTVTRPIKSYTPTENQRMSTRNDKLKRKYSTLSELEPTKSSLQGKYLLVLRGCQFLNSSKKILTFWWHEKTRSKRIQTLRFHCKKPNTLDAYLCRELGEPANLELKPVTYMNGWNLWYM